MNRPLESCDVATPYIHGSHLFPRGMTFLPGLHNQSIDETDGMYYIDFSTQISLDPFWIMDIFLCLHNKKIISHTKQLNSETSDSEILQGPLRPILVFKCPPGLHSVFNLLHGMHILKCKAILSSAKLSLKMLERCRVLCSQCFPGSCL